MAAGEVAGAAEGEPPEEVDLLTEKDLYKILGVPKGAKPDDIKKAYKKRSLKYHPDKNLGDPDAKLKFQKIAEAFSILSDEKKRLRYDKSGDMDLEDFDMDQFMNMWVGEMMEEGGIVDDMMQEVLPWTDNQDKMSQFMDEHVKSKGKKVLCTICQHTASTKRLMLAHFEQKHGVECEEWAKETIKSMKASFESFMKQVTGIGDSSGTFVLPDGTTADMSKVKGVPDIRAHMQQKVDKAKEAEAVMEMYRKLAGAPPEAKGPAVACGDPSTREVQQVPEYMPDAKEIAKILGVSPEEAEELAESKAKLLARLRDRIDKINEEEDEEAAAMEQMQGMFGDLGNLGDLDIDDLAAMGGLGDSPGLGGLGGLGGGLGGSLGGGLGGKGSRMGGKGGGLEGLLGGLGDLAPGMEADDLVGLEAMLGGMDPNDPAMLEALMGELGGMPPGMFGGRGGLGGPGGPGVAGSRAGGGLARGSREPPRDTGPTKEIGCKCGYSCGTMKALEKHLDRFRGDPAHEAQVTERPPSPPRLSRDSDFGRGLAGRHSPGFVDDLPPELAARLGAGAAPPRGAGAGAATGDGPELGCICGYSCGTTKALRKHFDKYAGSSSHGPN